MNIHQLSVTFVNEQDRLLVRVNSTDGEELRVWFTRRLMRDLLPLLTRIAGELEAKRTPIANADDTTRQMLADIKKQETLEHADFQTPFKGEAAALPLGADPLLVTEVRMNVSASGQLEIAFDEKLPDPAVLRGFQMAMDAPLLHGFMHLLDTAIAAAQWELPGRTALPRGTEPAAGIAAGGDKPRYLN